MKAALLKSWNELEMTTLEKPVPEADEALIRVIYAGVCGSDITVYKGLHMTAKAPVVLCHEILGRIERLPERYSGPLEIGDRVLVNPVIPCGGCAACRAGAENVCQNLKLIGIHVNGGFAEYVKAKVSQLTKPCPALSDRIAALGEPFAVAYHVVSRAGIGKGDKVLLIGAGTIGLTVALAAGEMGALRVVVSEISEERIGIAKKLGLETVSPEKIDLLEFAKAETGGAGFDVVIDASGSKAAVLQLPDLAKCRGTLVSMGLSGAPYEFIIGKVSFKEQTLIGTRLYSPEHFEAGVRMLSVLAEKIDPECMISDVLPLDSTCEAVEKMKNGQNLGKILIECGN